MAASKERIQGNMASRIFAGDKVMWVVLVTLLIYSLFLVYSNMAYNTTKNASQELIRQILFICIGMSGFYVAQLLSIKVYKRLVVPFLLLSLALTLYMVVSYEGPGVPRSLSLFGLEFQPFEFLKFAIVLNLARQLSTRQKQMDTLHIMPSFRISDWMEDSGKQLEILRTQTLPILVPIAVCCLITLKISNSTTIIIAASSLAMMFLSRVHKSDIIKIVIVGLAVGGLTLVAYGKQGSRSGTAQNRILSWTPDVLTKSVKPGNDKKEYYERHKNPDGTPKEHEQTLYAKMSIATGGLVGKGPGQSTNRYLSEADKDMAYAFIIEEYGLIGGIVLLFAFLLMYYRSMIIFLKCGTAFPGLLVLGIGTVIVLQAFMHMLVCVSLFPLTGQQLPMVSKGGTSLVLTLTMLGMVMGVSEKVDENL